MDSRKTPVFVPVPSEAATTWRDALLLVTDEFEAPPVILRVEDSIIGTLGNFSASTGKAKSKKTFNVCAIVAVTMTGGIGLMIDTSKVKQQQQQIDDLAKKNERLHSEIKRQNKTIDRERWEHEQPAKRLQGEIDHIYS